MTFVTGKTAHDDSHENDWAATGDVTGPQAPMFETVAVGQYDGSTDRLTMHPAPPADPETSGKDKAPPRDTPDSEMDVKNAEGLLSWVEQSDTSGYNAFNQEDDWHTTMDDMETGRMSTNELVDMTFKRWEKLNKDQRRTFVHYVFGYLAGGDDKLRSVLESAMAHAEHTK